MRDSSNFLKTDEQQVWTREEWRVRQLTMREEEIHRYKMESNWPAVLETLQTMLDLQSEVMLEKPKPGEEGTTLKGTLTKRYGEQNEKLKSIRQKWQYMSIRSSDPARRKNNLEDFHSLVEDIRDFIRIIYQNNVELGLSYQRKNDPAKAAYG